MRLLNLGGKGDWERRARVGVGVVAIVPAFYVALKLARGHAPSFLWLVDLFGGDERLAYAVLFLGCLAPIVLLKLALERRARKPRQ